MIMKWIFQYEICPILSTALCTNSAHHSIMYLCSCVFHIYPAFVGSGRNKVPVFLDHPRVKANLQKVTMP